MDAMGCPNHGKVLYRREDGFYACEDWLQDRLTQTCRVCGLKTATRRLNMEEAKQGIAGVCYPCWKKENEN